MIVKALVPIAAMLCLVTCSPAPRDDTAVLAQENLPAPSIEMAGEIWLEFYPALLMEATYATEDNQTLNVWSHGETRPDPNARQIIRPNLDTVYSHAWLDLSSGPAQMALPDMGERYFTVQVIDDLSQTIATFGSRTSGPGPLVLNITGPDDKNDAIPGQYHASAPSDYVWVLVRVESGGPDDADAIDALHAQMTLTAPNTLRALWPLALRGSTRAQAEIGGPPPTFVRDLDAQAYFSWVNRWLVAHPNRLPIADRTDLAALGITGSADFIWDKLTEDQHAALNGARAAAMSVLRGQVTSEGGTNRDGWYYLNDNWYSVDGSLVSLQQPDNHALRAGLAMEALGYLPAAEAVYVSAGLPRVGGETLTGADGAAYTLTFPARALPPVDAFWSVTVYDDAGFLIDNLQNRFSLANRDGLVTADDGTLTLHLATLAPFGRGDPRRANWLPIPGSEFSVTFRAYIPSDPISPGDTDWHLPPIIKTSE